MRIRTATKWEIAEVSLVPVPADKNALIRSQAMEPEITIDSPPETRVETNTQIRALTTRMNLPVTFTDGLIDREATIEEARAAVLEEIGNRAAPVTTARVGPSGDDPAVIHARQAEAFACRMSGAEPSDAARPYMVLSLADAARDALTRAGAKGVGMLGREELLTRALHTTSDFPALLTGAGNRVLMPAYQAAQSPIKTLSRQSNADDFRPKSLIKLGDFGRLKPVSESGEIKALSTGEAAEGYSLETFGGLFNLSRKAIINDDLGAFGRWAAMMGRAAADTEADQLAALLMQGNGAGPIMGEDAKRLFSADHANLATDGAVPDVEPLSEARLAMRRQKGPGGVSPISVVPKYLLVAADLETGSEKLLTTLAANTVADANPFSGKLTLLVEPRLPDGTWYVFADPAVMPVLEYAYLSSAPGPQLAARDGWDVLGREFRVVLDFGCGAVDWRGAYRNPGEL
ncbi:MAG: prohead protease/major capsid protein fusion protein [Acidobacteriota bacterium]